MNSPRVKVNITETKGRYGNKILEVREFNSLVEANEFCPAYNAGSDSVYVPGWYKHAMIVV